MEILSYQRKINIKIALFVVDNVSGMCKADFTGNDISRVVFP